MSSRHQFFLKDTIYHLIRKVTVIKYVYGNYANSITVVILNAEVDCYIEITEIFVWLTRFCKP